VEQYFSLTVNQPQPAYKPKNSLPNRAFLFQPRIPISEGSDRYTQNLNNAKHASDRGKNDEHVHVYQ
jgi:hypothetical protein